MKIAVPTAQGRLCAHFGHCESFAVMNIENDTVSAIENLTPPPHEPGLLPRWLAEKGATHIIAGGIGMRAQNLFQTNNIQVLTGAPPLKPAELARLFLKGELVCGANTCDH